MRALVCRQHGQPSDLVLEELPAPVPAAGEVRIAVRACGINFPDVLMVAGKYQVQPELPFVPGAELAGEIVETGAGVEGLEPGQRVCALTGHGALAEEACVAASRVVPIPAAMDFDTAAGFLLTWGTAFHALRQRAALAPGETLLVLGAAGGVGLCAVQLGRVMGAEVIAAASSADKLDLAARCGATGLVDYGKDSLRDRVKALTGGRGADVIFDPVGGELFDACLRSVAWRGRILIVGFASGEIQQIPANLPLLKGCAVVGVFWGRFVEQEPEVHRDNLEQLFALFESGRITPHVSATYALDEAAAALDALASRRATGKLVVRP